LFYSIKRYDESLFIVYTCNSTGGGLIGVIFYETASGKINAIEFEAEKPTSDTLLCIHGFCCDARIFTYIGRKLSASGYNVVSIDLPGHNMSDGKKGELDFDTCIKSLHQIILRLKKRSARVFILAHSMGCIFSLWYAHLFKASIDGLILLCPHVRVPHMKRRYDAEPDIVKFFLLFFARIFTPNKRLNIIEDFPAYVKAGGDEVAWMMKDSQVNFRYSYRFVVDILGMRNSKISQLSDVVNIPVLILHGRKDRMMYPQVSEKFFRLLNTDMKEIKIFDCDHWFYDAIFYDQSFSRHREESRMQIISCIADWLKWIDRRRRS
jgi:pimeloyl-ACP methyl ester carboxylesterase